MNKTSLFRLILNLIIIEHLLWPVLISLQDFIIEQESFLQSLTYTFSNQIEFRSMVAVFIIRFVLWILPLLFLFTTITNNIKVRNVLSLALINVISNVLIIGLYSFLLFDGLITLPATTDTIILTFVSPFILNILPFSKHHVHAIVTGVSEPEEQAIGTG